MSIFTKRAYNPYHPSHNLGLESSVPTDKLDLIAAWEWSFGSYFFLIYQRHFGVTDLGPVCAIIQWELMSKDDTRVNEWENF